MCPNPGMILNITATASLALPSAVSVVALRFQSHRSQLCASFGRRCPQYGHGIVSPALGSGRVAGASVYSTFISIVEGSQTARNSSRKRIQKKTTTDDTDYTDRFSHEDREHWACPVPSIILISVPSVVKTSGCGAATLGHPRL